MPNGGMNAGENNTGAARLKAGVVAAHRHPVVRGVVFQIALTALVAWGLVSFFQNAIENLEARNIKSGLHFIDEVAPFGLPLNYHPFWDFKLGESEYWEVFVVGVQNTILISALGIVTALVLGFVIGVLRLSPNWAVRKITSAYIEIFRNTPLLLQLLFWNFAVFLKVLPPPRQSLNFSDAAFLNKAGLYLPKPVLDGGDWALMIVGVALGLAVWRGIKRWAQKRQDLTGQTFPAALCGVAVTFALAVIALAAGEAGIDLPSLQGFNYKGGMYLPLPGFVLWFGLSVYTASFIAENVRAGIMAVAHGQTEAAHALGLHRRQTLWLVIIPQAMRVIIPPIISQFLNLTKNSSLAVAVAYPELVNVWTGIALNQTGQALVIVAMTFAVYQTLSLMTSLYLNYLNKKAQLTER